MDIINNIFAQAVILSALAVMSIQQLLKLQLVPMAFANKYPVPTLIILSVAAAIVATLTTPLNPATFVDWVILVATIAVTAALTYRNTLRNWAQLRSMEGEGK